MKFFSPSLKSRRLTIAGLVLLVLGGGLWWSMRPKIDPRLVGTWEYAPEQGVIEEEHYITTYQPNGRFRVKCSDFPDDMMAMGDRSGLWWVEGDRLVEFTPLERGRLEGLKEFISVRFFHRQPSGTLGPLTYRRSVIVETSPSEFSTRDQFGRQFTYRRVIP